MTTVANTDAGVEIRLERIQAAVDVGNAETKGALAMLMLRSDQNEKVADERAARLAVELRDRDTRLVAEFKERDDRMDKSDNRIEALEKRVQGQFEVVDTKLQGISKQLWILVGGTGALSGTAAAVVQVLMRH